MRVLVQRSLCSSVSVNEKIVGSINHGLVLFVGFTEGDGMEQIDYLIDKKTEKVYINEPNTIPGSLSFYLWEPKGKKYKDLLDDLITMSIKEYKNKLKKTYCFDTNILKDFKLKSGVKK